MITLIVFLLIYLIIAILMMRCFWIEDIEIERRRTLKSFYYGLFFPITLIYQYFNGGYLE